MHEREEPLAFSMTYVDGDTTLPTQTSKDPGMPPSLADGQAVCDAVDE